MMETIEADYPMVRIITVKKSDDDREDTRTTWGRLAESINRQMRDGFVYQGFIPTSENDEWQILFTKAKDQPKLGQKADAINRILRESKGIIDVEAEWWNVPSDSLDGDSPHYVWFGDSECSRADEVRAAAEALPDVN